MRWSEEVDLLQEEMRRVLQFFDWQATWWGGQKERRLAELPEEQEGLRAYAARQGSLRREFCQHFNRLWEPYLSQTATASGLSPPLSNPPPNLNNLAELPDLSAPLRPTL
jgi:hypothetical protein